MNSKPRFWFMTLLVNGCLPMLAILPVKGSETGEAAATLVQVSRYRHYVNDLLFIHDGHNRGFGSEHDLARDNIVDLFESFGLTVTLEPFQFFGSTYYNVVGTKFGTLDASIEYVIGAHYDSVNDPGADDDASGVSVVMEAARVLSAFNTDYTIRFIAFDREEQGMIGSQAYVEDHLEDDISAMIAFDQVAWNDGTNTVQVVGRPTASQLTGALVDAVMMYGEGLGYRLLEGDYGSSDHDPFQLAGFVACIMGEAGLNPYRHTSQDSVDTPGYIDYGYGARITRVVVGYLAESAGGTFVEVVPVVSEWGLVVMTISFMVAGTLVAMRSTCHSQQRTTLVPATQVKRWEP